VSPRADLEDFENGVASLGSGSVSTLTTYPGARLNPHREFPPGFHGANPGPSFDEPAASPRRTRRPS
jgi:hypothetical protein